MTTYKEAGVDIDAANNALEKVKKHAKTTFNKHTLSDIGSFGGCFNFPSKDFSNPVLVSSVDGVGTKLLIANLANRHDTIGQCLVNHCVNDILVIGAKPLFFLDYFAAGKLDNDILDNVIKGFSIACKQNKCVLIGGETAEMPGFYDNKKYDVSGTVIGVVERNNMLSNRKTKKGDVLIGLPSNGLHTNGYSLARKVLLDKYKVGVNIDSLGCSVDEELLKIHKSYLNVLSPILDKPWLKALSHITGGGLIENTHRVLEKNQDVKINWSSWEWPNIFKLIQEEGNIKFDDMVRPFNLGIGMVLIINKTNLEELESYLDESNQVYHQIGEVI
ncbi:MAG: phosphoribosylformylglycinamidine cyclo-ligase [Candidatus Marinimicrobia bacterium]|nr:phosphoribosylformylglycinamidine cyclo-ligase [Candidatus Neomarinimicrobiota bacterium]